VCGHALGWAQDLVRDAADQGVGEAQWEPGLKQPGASELVGGVCRRTVVEAAQRRGLVYRGRQSQDRDGRRQLLGLC
jgi:hypothetical protein